MTDRFDRQERFFGKEGQAEITAVQVVVVGVGGLGTHAVQQLALLGVGEIGLIDSEELATTDRNRYVTARHDDPIPGMSKVDIAERLIKSIDPSIRVEKVNDSLVTEAGFAAVSAADYVFGCLDTEGARLVLNELCAAYDRPYLDLASDIIPADSLIYGGRVCIAWGGTGCLVCRGLLDVAEAQADLATEGERKARELIYGIHRSELDEVGPSVVSINGVVASLAVTEFVVGVTGLRAPRSVLNYRGDRGIVSVSADAPAPDCYYCQRQRGRREAAEVERYLRAGVGEFLR